MEGCAQLFPQLGLHQVEFGRLGEPNTVLPEDRDGPCRLWGRRKQEETGKLTKSRRNGIK